MKSLVLQLTIAETTNSNGVGMFPAHLLLSFSVFIPCVIIFCVGRNLEMGKISTYNIFFAPYNYISCSNSPHDRELLPDQVGVQGQC